MKESTNRRSDAKYIRCRVISYDYDKLSISKKRGVNVQETEQTVRKENDLQMIKELRLMDDDFFSEALDGKIEAVEYILKTILERDDIKVTSTKAQVEYKSAAKRSIRLDIQAEDVSGKIMDIEIQRSDRGSGVKRARFHSSMIDRPLLSKGEDFEDLVDTYVIFITENDKFGMGIPLYHVERRIEEMDYALFGDGAHILYVNGEYRNMEHPVGCLMHDFNCKNAEDIMNPLLAEEVRYLKETEGGRGRMCKLLEEMRAEAAAEAAAKARKEGKLEGNHEKAVCMALKMLARGRDSMEEISEMTDLSLEEVRELSKKQTA
ncbi:MAG: PD-(D/E)XK nuclease family transposase [Blautia sp.]|nr:PD-(D/E)XK nuclease family transposase [Blautia sp.]